MALQLTKEDMINSINFCMTSYYDPTTHLLKLECYNDRDPAKGYKGLFEGYKEDFTLFLRYEHFRVANNSGFYGVQNKNGTMIGWIVISGSDDNQDWQYNFDFTNEQSDFNLEPYGKKDSKIGIHQGFLKDYQQIRSKIHEIVNFFLSIDVKTIIVTGHSLGGAQTQLCAVDIQYNFADKLTEIIAIPHASPRVFNEAGAVSYEKRVPRTYRVNNAFDPVPKVPMAYLNMFGGGYRPVFPKKEVHVNWNFAMNFSPINWMPIARLTSANDHYPTLYRKGLIAYNEADMNRIINS